MLYITSLPLLYFITGILYLFTTFLHFPLPPSLLYSVLLCICHNLSMLLLIEIYTLSSLGLSRVSFLCMPLMCLCIISVRMELLCHRVCVGVLINSHICFILLDNNFCLLLLVQFVWEYRSTHRTKRISKASPRSEPLLIFSLPAPSCTLLSWTLLADSFLFA